jgi:hypothetical protein
MSMSLIFTAVILGFAGKQCRPWTAPAPTMANPNTLSSQKLAEGTILKPPNTKGSQFRLAHWWCQGCAHGHKSGPPFWHDADGANIQSAFRSRGSWLATSRTSFCGNLRRAAAKAALAIASA